MTHFFERIITSELAGCKKPSATFFDFALEQANCLPNEVVMVGDHPVIDILAAEAVGIAAVHLNFRAEQVDAKIQISQLAELLNLFE